MIDMRPAKHVRNPDKYYDRTVQEWHMTAFPKAFTAIDVDLYGYCPKCYVPTYVIEAAETRTKPVSVLTKLGDMLDVPALLIVHEGQQLAAARRVNGATGCWRTPEELHEYIVRLRQAHRCAS